MTKYRATLSYNRRHRAEIAFEAPNDAVAAALRRAIVLWARAAINRDENAADNAGGYIVVDRMNGDAFDEEIDDFELIEEPQARSSLPGEQAPAPTVNESAFGLTAEDALVLSAFRVAHGRRWKQKLAALWESGNDAAENDGWALRRIRNRLGPSWLASIRFPYP